MPHILFGDEATFTRDESVDMHNAQHYSYGDHPHVTNQTKHQHRFRINVWIYVVGNNQLGPALYGLCMTDVLHILT